MKTITRQQADVLLAAYRDLNKLAGTGVERNSMLMLAWISSQDILRQAIVFGGWKLYFDPAANQMDIEE